jgi:hypothetical protein
VPLIPSVRELLDLYRLRLGNPTTGVMFATEVGTPLDLKNVFTRRIDPIPNACAECGETQKKHLQHGRFVALALADHDGTAHGDGVADHEYRRRDDLVEWHGAHARFVEAWGVI